MALQITYQTQMGFIATEAYVRIVSFSGDKDTIIANTVMYFNKASREAGADSIGNLTVFLPLQYGATMQEMYEALKLQEPFINAIDI